MMYTIKYEKTNHVNDIYTLDSDENIFEKSFQSLTELEKWIFHFCYNWTKIHSNKISKDYKDKYMYLYFPDPDDIQAPITFKPIGNTFHRIHLIESEKGIEFSTGKYTNCYAHASQTVKAWLNHCQERRDFPKFNFVD